ncbi:head-to-tail connector protein [Gordonia phage Ghobes]|uniref:Head-to-tail connector protein n=1 Tax=Gordonia phage Ghobes TaxID=1887647 RepID=A0A1B3B014_9CAUD|nr:head closure Hc1 [Gordonia phage Ghobes]AOE44360.1 head-to-tail connector protein [Gordonia phage Ghobes]
MSFFQQQLQQVVPAVVSSTYGNAKDYDYSEDRATVTDLPFLVDLQPVLSVRNRDGQRELATENRWKFFTPEGTDLEVQKWYRYRWLDQEYDVEGVKRWPSAEFASGVDHVVVELLLREG